MNTHISRRGASLLELTLWIGLASLLLTVLSTLMVLSWRTGARLFTRFELAAETRLLGRAVAWDLARSSAEGVTLVRPDLTVIQPQATQTAERAVQWQDELIVYWLEAGRVGRGARPLAAGTSRTAPAPLPGLAALTAPGPEVRRLSDHVKTWSLTREGGLYRWRCELEREVPGHPRPEHWQVGQNWQVSAP